MYADFFKFIDWQHDGFQVQGLSVAGIGTSFYLPKLKLTIDVAQGVAFSMKAKVFLITHGHLDHAAGIPYIISQKALNSVAPPIFHMPDAMLAPLTEIMQSWQKIEGHTYKTNFHASKIGEMVLLNKNYGFKAFQTFHRVPSNGYLLIELRQKLREEYVGKHREEILKLKEGGVQVHDEVELPIFAYTGDTTMEFWDVNPEVRRAKILFMEVTYWDQKKSIENAREWGHIHLDEIIERLHEFEGEKLVFVHASERYSLRELRETLRKRIPQNFQDKVEVFAGQPKV